MLRLLMQLSKSPVPPDHTDVEHQNQLRDSVLKTLEDYWCECCVDDCDRGLYPSHPGGSVGGGDEYYESATGVLAFVGKSPPLSLI